MTEKCFQRCKFYEIFIKMCPFSFIFFHKIIDHFTNKMQFISTVCDNSRQPKTFLESFIIPINIILLSSKNLHGDPNFKVQYSTHGLIDTICSEKNVSIPALVVFLAVFFQKFDKQSQNVSIRA